MPLPADTDVSSPKYLRDQYAIVGVGETPYTRGSGMTTRALGAWAVRNAILDAGLKAADIDGKLAPPDLVKTVCIGPRVRMVFSDASPGLSLPQWTIDGSATQPDKPWRYPQE